MTALAVEEKFDGIRMTLHRKGDKVALITEDQKRDRASVLPQIVKDLLKLDAESFILDSEMVWWKNGQPLPREKMVAIVVGKESLGDEDIRVNVFDILYIDGQDIHKEPWTERQKHLKKLIPKDVGHIHRVIPIIVHNKQELVKAIKGFCQATFRRGYD
jgi:DNA ligase-1